MFFTVFTIVSYQNNNVYATSLENISDGIRIHFIRQKPSGIMVGAVISAGSKGVEMNSRVYQKILCFPGCQPHLEVVISLQNRALAHTASLVQNRCQRNFRGILTGLFDLHQSLTLSPWILQYKPYWREMFHVSHTQVLQIRKKLL